MSARQPSSGYWTEIYRSSRGRRPANVTPKMDALNVRLNASETMLRGRVGDQQVDDLIVQFLVAGKKDPALFKALYKKRDPYRWLAQHWAPKQPPTTH